jgi:hypothetical protein
MSPGGVVPQDKHGDRPPGVNDPSYEGACREASSAALAPLTREAARALTDDAKAHTRRSCGEELLDLHERGARTGTSRLLRLTGWPSATADGCGGPQLFDDPTVGATEGCTGDFKDEFVATRNTSGSRGIRRSPRAHRLRGCPASHINEGMNALEDRVNHSLDERSKVTEGNRHGRSDRPTSVSPRWAARSAWRSTGRRSNGWSASGGGGPTAFRARFAATAASRGSSATSSASTSSAAAGIAPGPSARFERRSATAAATCPLRSSSRCGRLASEIDALQPVPVPLPEQPDDALPAVRVAHEGFRLLLAFRGVDLPARPVAYSVHFCRAWCEFSHRGARFDVRKLRPLEGGSLSGGRLVGAGDFAFRRCAWGCSPSGRP